MILDATAGNRTIWPNKNPPQTIFMDKETRLWRSPDIFADFRFCPFRDNIFETVIFDPPNKITTNPPKWWSIPDGRKHDKGVGTSWYGWWNNKRECFSSIDKAQREFARIAKRLCLKWGEVDLSLWKILPFFRDWKVIQTKEHKHPNQRGKNRTYWVTMIHIERGKGNILDKKVNGASLYRDKSKEGVDKPRGKVNGQSSEGSS